MTSLESVANFDFHVAHNTFQNGISAFISLYGGLTRLYFTHNLLKNMTYQGVKLDGGTVPLDGTRSHDLYVEHNSFIMFDSGADSETTVMARGNLGTYVQGVIAVEEGISNVYIRSNKFNSIKSDTALFEIATGQTDQPVTGVYIEDNTVNDVLTPASIVRINSARRSHNSEISHVRVQRNVVRNSRSSESGAPVDSFLHTGASQFVSDIVVLDNTIDDVDSFIGRAPRSGLRVHRNVIRSCKRLVLNDVALPKSDLASNLADCPNH
jgi:hypothetical protein